MPLPLLSEWADHHDIFMTHNGAFHFDDVAASVILSTVFPHASFMRTRNPELLAKAKLLFDVGYEYHPEKLRFDHHQPSKPYRKNGIPYSAFGLIVKHYGESYLSMLTGNTHPEELAWMRQKWDKLYVQGYCALDNGFDLMGALPVPLFTTAHRLDLYNPLQGTSEDYDQAFQVAFEEVKQEMEQYVQKLSRLVPTLHQVQVAFDQRVNPHILVLDTMCEWREVIHDVDPEGQIQFVVYPAGEEDYRVQVVPQNEWSYQARKPLPLAWEGKRGTELDALTGLTDTVICLMGRWMAIAKQKETAIRLAKMAVENQERR